MKITKAKVKRYNEVGEANFNDMISMIKKAISSNPHNRLTTPDDVADFISVLANYNSSWMTGNIIRVDGGEDITS